MESFYKALRQFNVNDVKYTETDEYLKEFLSNLDFVFFKRNIGKGIIHRYGSILVGFYSDEKVTFEVESVGYIMAKHTLEPGQFVFAACDTVLPLCATQFCHVNVSAPITCIFAELNTQLRNNLMCKTIRIDDYCLKDGFIRKGLECDMALPKFQYGKNRVEQMKVIQKGALELFIKKNEDYGDAFATFGIVGVLVRIQDKLNRMVSVTKNGITLVNDESLRDTLIDLHNYSAMGLMLS